MFDPSDFAGKKPSIACELSCGRVLPSSSTLPHLSKISLVHPRLRIYSTDSVQKMLLPNAVGLVEAGQTSLKKGKARAEVNVHQPWHLPPVQKATPYYI
jgi:hypothetical protein